MCVDYVVKQKWVMIRTNKHPVLINSVTNKVAGVLTNFPPNESLMRSYATCQLKLMTNFHPVKLFIVLYIIICNEGVFCCCLILAVQLNPHQ